ncbi:MAG: xanthine dehydrogenase family protein subunit M [Acidobacteriota bacterium]|nr:xanthine dehydrogenase family protein subunit M [Acidobacteriota bacterium]
MKSFRWAEPQSIEQAVALLAKGNGSAVLMAGGTDLLTEIKEGVASPEIVIDVKSIPGLDFVTREKGMLRIGAAASVAGLAADPEIEAGYPGLRQAALSLATPQLRHVGTVGGNLCQRPRCWYYRDAQAACRKKGGSRCFAFRGRNKYHAILGGGLCYAVCPSDLAPALISLDAQVVIASLRGDKTMPLAEFFVLPAKNVRRENILGVDEMLREVRLPSAGKGGKSVYVKLRERGTWDFALVSAAVKGTVSGKRVKDVRIVLGGVAPIPWRLAKAEASLQGKNLDERLIKEAVRSDLQEAKPLEENGYKTHLAEAAVSRALLALVEGIAGRTAAGF